MLKLLRWQGGDGDPRQILSDGDGVRIIWMDLGVRLYSMSVNGSFLCHIPSSLLPATFF